MHRSILSFPVFILLAGCAVALPPPPNTTHPANPHAAEAPATDPAESLNHDSATGSAGARAERDRAQPDATEAHHAH